MRVWTNKEFIGHYPVGSAAVVVAEFATDAAEYLNLFLREAGLPETTAQHMVELKMEEGEVVILCDGNY